MECAMPSATLETDVSQFEKPEAAFLTKAAVSQIAEHFAKRYEVLASIDMADVVERIGGEVSYTDVWARNIDQISGSLNVPEVGRFQIFVPVHTTYERDNFTIAHELGHYFIHFLLPKSQGKPIRNLMAYRYGTGRIEWEANWFAAAFLMPSEDYREMFSKLAGDIDGLAGHFRVSREAARIRSVVLGLVSNGQTTKRNKKSDIEAKGTVS
jgi:IrrE N-terminal-like domain